MKRKASAEDRPRANAKAAPGRKPTLKREEIVSAALSIIDEQGYQALTMHSIARHLGTGPATLYNYFESLAEIEDAIAGRLMAAVRPPQSDGAVRDQLVEMTVAYHDVVAQHPQVDLLSGPVAAQTRARLLNSAVRALVQSGVPLEAAGLALSVLSGFAYSAAVAARVEKEQQAKGMVVVPKADRDMLDALKGTAFFGGTRRANFRRAVETIIDRLMPELSARS
ncbi:TetR/AcrR family transcriptional regulator [Solimonas variicoloris]|uniref:TetR/AcrR family transcriptional regulator n=1 Tax=Solimonas variicoloris TaxID=254408 RepID=UPI0003673385|nr:TetR/AcrR family transcriptional regulator [Solimonas variicoloris]